MRASEYSADEIHHHDHLDAHLVKVLRALLKAKQADSDYYGWVGSAVMDPEHNIVFGINHKDGEGKRYHAERVAVNKYMDQYGPIPHGSIVLTTCSPCNEPMEERHGESCTEFLNQSGVKKVYCGYTDPSQTSDEPREFTLEETRNPEIRELCKQLASNFLDAKTQGIEEAFDQPYNMKWEKSQADDDSYDALVRLPDGSNLSIMFNQDYDDEGEGIYSIEFWRNNSQDVTGEGDAQRIFATVLNAIQQFIKKHHPNRFYFSASKEMDMDADDVEHFNPESRAKLYNRLVQRYAGAWGYRVQIQDQSDIVRYQLTRLKQGVVEATGDERFDSMMGQIQREPRIPDSQMPPTDVKDLYHWAVKHHKPYHKIFAKWAMREGFKSVAPALQKAGNLDSDAIDYWTPEAWKLWHGGELPQGYSRQRIPEELRDYLETVFDAYDRIVFDWPTEYRQIKEQGVAENFADGKNPGRKGLAKRSGVNTKASVSSLRKTAKNSSGEKQRMAHWLANMKAGRAKKK